VEALDTSIPNSTESSVQVIGDAKVLDLILNLSEGKSGAGLMANAQVYGGDRGTVETILALMKSAKPFDEVWLNSGGGQVDAGVGIARVLREHRMTVRVPANFQCISSCTIAFMGGVLRFVDSDATYRVHSASNYEGGVDDDTVAALKANPDRAMIQIAQSQQIDQRYFALRVMTLFENTLLIPARKPLLPEDDSAFCTWAGGQPQSVSLRDGRTIPYCDTESKVSSIPLPYAAPASAERKADVARIRHEGPAAYQDILMRIERECLQAALKDLQPTVAEQEPRAGAALNMIRTMFITSIKDTNYLSSDQLVTMGYVTPTFNAGK
jgi:hypothetical protein